MNDITKLTDRIIENREYLKILIKKRNLLGVRYPDIEKENFSQDNELDNYFELELINREIEFVEKELKEDNKKYILNKFLESLV